MLSNDWERCYRDLAEVLLCTKLRLHYVKDQFRAALSEDYLQYSSVHEYMVLKAILEIMTKQRRLASLLNSQQKLCRKNGYLSAVIKKFLDKMNLPNVDQLLHPDDSQNMPLAVSEIVQLSGTLTPTEEVILL